jgi:hypothetical protein
VLETDHHHQNHQMRVAVDCLPRTLQITTRAVLTITKVAHESGYGALNHMCVHVIDAGDITSKSE